MSDVWVVTLSIFLLTMGTIVMTIAVGAMIWAAIFYPIAIIPAIGLLFASCWVIAYGMNFYA